MSTAAAPSTRDGHPTLLPAPEVPERQLLEVIGEVPTELAGTLYRNGPARWEGGGFVAQHAFDGDGLVSQFVIKDGRVSFRSRYVRTPKFLAEEAGRGRGVRGMGTQRKGGLLGNIGRLPADSANTHAIVHAERLLALSDAGRPWELDLDDLTTRGECTFDGVLPRFSRFSPHPRHDPNTGEMFNFGIDFAPRGLKAPIGLRCYRFDPSGRLHIDATVPLDHLYIQHDFALTENYYVFVLAPFIADPIGAALGAGTMESAVSWRSDVPTKIVLVPRGGGPQRHIECPPLVYVHINNAYEDRGDVVVDLVRYDDYSEFFDPVRDFRTPSGSLGGLVSRVRLMPSGRIEVSAHHDVKTELPQHDWRRSTRPYRYGYHATVDQRADVRNRIVKLDMETGATQEHVFAPGDAVGEPMFVPRSSASAEDDGWLLTVVYRAAEGRSALMILDAQDPSREPVATALTDVTFFPGFHGSFTERIAGA